MSNDSVVKLTKVHGYNVRDIAPIDLKNGVLHEGNYLALQPAHIVKSTREEVVSAVELIVDKLIAANTYPVILCFLHPTPDGIYWLGSFFIFGQGKQGYFCVSDEGDVIPVKILK